MHPVNCLKNINDVSRHMNELLSGKFACKLDRAIKFNTGCHLISAKMQCTVYCTRHPHINHIFMSLVCERAVLILHCRKPLYWSHFLNC